MAETGLAAFGPRGHYGVVTSEDMAQLLVWVIGCALRDDELVRVGQGRGMVRKIMPMLKPVDQLMLAEMADAGDFAWKTLAEELRELANRPPFNQ